MKRIPILLVVLASLATACGGSADADAGVASLDESVTLDETGVETAPEPTEEEALLAFTACLRDQGVDIDDPTVDADGNLRIARPNAAAEDPEFDREAFRGARESCGELLEGVNLGFQAEDRTEIEDQLLEYAACMRDNGFDMPDPDFSSTPGQGGGGGPFGQLDRDDPAFQSAQEACAEIIDGFGRGGGPGGGPGRGAGN